MNLRERLNESEPLVADGAAATALYDKGFYINRSFEELCITEPQVVREVTQSFKQAGANILHTNTFSAIRSKLLKFGIQDRVAEILQEATKIALEVANDDAFVLGAIGPVGLVLEPLGPTSKEEASQLFTENVEILEKAGVHGISFLGFHDLNELKVAVAAAKKVTKLPIFAHLGIQENMKTSYGHSLEEHIKSMEKLDVDVIGFSGEVGPSGMLTVIERVRGLTKKPLSILPNAGLPRYVNDQYIYMCNPDYLGKFSKRYIQAGANIVGGFSGVKDEHTRAITNALRMTQSIAPQHQQYTVPEAIRITVDEPQKVVPRRKRSKLGAALEAREKVVTVEIIPPKGVDCSKFFEHCKELEEGGVEYVNIPDGARAVARMGSLALASYVSQNFNLEPIPHFTTRDRNLIGLQGDLLGAYVNGVRNVLLVTGDPPKLGNCPGATAVYDVDAIGLTHVVSRMNQGLDLGGSSFGKPAEFLTGVALNPTARNRELEIQRFKYKIEAGADYAITQPIYDLESYESFFDDLGDINIPIIMGIWPLVSLRNAEFLKNEVPGVDVPDWAIDEMKRANGDKEEAIKRGADIAIKTMDEAKKFVSGFQVSAPFNRVSVALNVIKSLG